MFAFLSELSAALRGLWAPGGYASTIVNVGDNAIYFSRVSSGPGHVTLLPGNPLGPPGSSKEISTQIILQSPHLRRVRFEDTVEESQAELLEAARDNLSKARAALKDTDFKEGSEYAQAIYDSWLAVPYPMQTPTPRQGRSKDFLTDSRRGTVTFTVSLNTGGVWSVRGTKAFRETVAHWLLRLAKSYPDFVNVLLGRVNQARKCIEPGKKPKTKRKKP